MDVDRADDPRLGDYVDLADPAARRRREREELLIAEGPVAIERLLASGLRVRSVLVSDRVWPRLEAMLATLDAPVYVAPIDVLRATVGFDLHRGAVAAADRPALTPLAEVLTGCTRVAVLEGLNDPENLGAIARSARGLGVGGLVLDSTCMDPYARRTVRVSMGEVLFLPVCRPAPWPEAFDRLHDAGFETWALTPAGDADDIWDVDVPERLALVLGAEGPGLPASSLRRATRRVRIPLHHGVDSLNVAAAAAVAFAVTARPT